MRGNPIEHGLYSWDATRYPPVEHADQRPLKLNINRPVKMHGHDLLSSQEWSGAFYRYLTPAFEAAADQAKGRTSWWHQPYILDRLVRDTALAANQLAAIVAVRCQGMAWDRALVTFGCTKEQLGRLERRIHRQYLPRAA